MVKTQSSFAILSAKERASAGGGTAGAFYKLVRKLSMWKGETIAEMKSLMEEKNSLATSVSVESLEPNTKKAKMQLRINEDPSESSIRTFPYDQFRKVTEAMSMPGEFDPETLKAIRKQHTNIQEKEINISLFKKRNKLYTHEMKSPGKLIEHAGGNGTIDFLSDIESEKNSVGNVSFDTDRVCNNDTLGIAQVDNLYHLHTKTYLLRYLQKMNRAKSMQR
jgi:hypothetical protein